MPPAFNSCVRGDKNGQTRSRATTNAAVGHAQSIVSLDLTATLSER
jgi:hypothetical protein